MNTTVPTSLYAQRRARVAQQLGANGIAVIPTAPERQRNRDSDFLFRHDSYFYYLSGFTEPNAWLVVTSEGQSTLFCQPKDLEREIWDGYRLGPEAAVGALGVDAAHPVSELDRLLPRLLENRDVVWYPFAIHPGLEQRIAGWLNQVRARVRYGALCPEQQSDLCAVLDEMRLVKDAHEQDVMRRAAAISARVSVEAASRFGWAEWIGLDGTAVGIDRFGLSAPGAEALAELGITPEAVAGAARALTGRD